VQGYPPGGRTHRRSTNVESAQVTPDHHMTILGKYDRDKYLLEWVRRECQLSPPAMASTSMSVETAIQLAVRMRPRSYD